MDLNLEIVIKFQTIIKLNAVNIYKNSFKYFQKSRLKMAFILL